MESLCLRTQEDIAWGRALSAQFSFHILSCPYCKKTALEFANLDSLVKQEFEASIPERFVDQVMQKIEKLERPNQVQTAFIKLIKILEIKTVQYAVTSIGVLLISTNLAH